MADNRGGIYKITNIVNDKFYIGSSVNIRKRRNDHRLYLNKNIHRNRYLQRAWNKYTSSNFKFETLEIVENKEQLLNREQFYLDTLLFAQENNKKFRNLGYNICRKAGSRLGQKTSEATKELMRKNRKGKKKPQSFIDKMRELRTGYKLSNETKLKISQAHLGKKQSLETREKRMNKGVKKIVKVTKDLELIECFESIKDAALKYKVKHCTVGGWLKVGLKKSEYLWMYFTEYQIKVNN